MYKIKRKEVIWHSIFFLTIISSVCLYNIDKLSSPYFVPDEMGYWTAGAWVNGLDWSSVMSNSGYYGFGYGILLAFLFWLPNSVVMYRGAIVLNIMMVLGCYLIICSISRRLFPDIKYTVIQFIGSVVSVYTYHIVYSQMTQAEILLTFLFLLSCLQLIKFYESPSYMRMFFFSFLNVAMFATHFRTLVILMISSLLLMWSCIKKDIKVKYLCCFIMVIALGVVGTFYLKSILVSSQYADIVGSVQTHNDFSSRSGVLSSILTLDGFVRLLLGIGTRLFYSGCATFGLFYYGLYSLSKDVMSCFFLKKNDKYLFLKIYLLLSVIASIMISSMAMLYPSRVDHILYGRYFENTIALIIAIGIYYVYKNKFMLKTFCIFSIIHILLATATNYFFSLSGSLGNPLLLEICGIAAYWGNVGMPYASYYSWGIGIISIIVSVFVGLLIGNRQIKMKIMGIGIVGFLWIVLAITSLESYYTKTRYQELLELAENIEKYGEEFYYVLPPVNDRNGGSFYDLYNLRFDMPKVVLNAIDEKEINLLPDGAIIILHDGYSNKTDILKTCDILWMNEAAYILQK